MVFSRFERFSCIVVFFITVERSDITWGFVFSIIRDSAKYLGY